MKKSYEQICKEFSWEIVLKSLDCHSNYRFNLAHEACDKHARTRGKVAFYREREDSVSETITFSMLKEYSNKLANTFTKYGIKKGDRVCCLMGKKPELYITLLATLKTGAIYVPLFTAFGQDALSYRIKQSHPKIIVTDLNNLEKITSVNPDFNQTRLIVSQSKKNEAFISDFWQEIEEASNYFTPVSLSLDDFYLLLFTSGSTGPPKGVLWSNKTILQLIPYLKYAIDLQESDVFLGPADPAWSLGVNACTLGPFLMGTPFVACELPFTPELFYYLLEKYRVTNFLYAPTAYRNIKGWGTPTEKKYSLRAASSAGEPLNSPLIDWFKEIFGVEIHDQYGLTEVGMLLNNYNASNMEIKPGSMGLPTPGHDVKLLNEHGEQVQKGEAGEIVFNNASGLGYAFKGYWGDLNGLEPDKQDPPEYFYTGDYARQDADGYFWFESRKDDMIISSGYRISPFEVESTLLKHDSVSESAVIGKPDYQRGNIVKAFVILHDNTDASEKLKQELQSFVKEKLARHVYPREIDFVEELPKTISGKIQRYKLREKEINQ